MKERSKPSKCSGSEKNNNRKVVFCPLYFFFLTVFKDRSHCADKRDGTTYLVSFKLGAGVGNDMRG